MAYFDGYVSVGDRMDAKCGKGWEGVKGKCKRIKKKQNLAKVAEQITARISQSTEKALNKKGLSRVGLAAFIVGASYVGLSVAINAIASKNNAAFRKRNPASLESSMNLATAHLEAGQRDKLREELKKLEASRERRSSIKHEQQLKDFFSNVSELAGSESEVMNVNSDLLNKIQQMSPSEMDKFFEQRRKEYGRLMEE